jgi:hypothetical protein
VLTPEYQHCLFPYSTFSIVDNDLGTLFVSWQKAMTQPNLTYTPLILATHKNCVTTSNMPSSSSSSRYSSKPIVSTNSSKAASFQLTSTTSAGQEASNRQQRSMGDAAIAVMEEEEEEHIFRSRFPPVDVPDGITVPEFVLAGAEAYADKVALAEAAPGGLCSCPTPTARWTSHGRHMVSLGVMVQLVAAGGRCGQHRAHA